jgi:proline dehydrogenase
VSLVDSAIVRLLPAVPKQVVRRISEHYIAGEELDDALRVVLELNAEGKLATLDVLGEEVTDPEEARAIAGAYREAIDAFKRGSLDSNISVKPTALGLNLSYELFRENLEDVVRHAAELDNFVRIDMEDSSTTDDTLRIYRELREAGHDNVGIVLQARLKRTIDDVRTLAELRPNVRICKGIYLEPPEIAFRDFGAVQASFVRTLKE